MDHWAYPKPSQQVGLGLVRHNNNLEFSPREALRRQLLVCRLNLPFGVQEKGLCRYVSAFPPKADLSAAKPKRKDMQPVEPLTHPFVEFAEECELNLIPPTLCVSLY